MLRLAFACLVVGGLSEDCQGGECDASALLQTGKMDAWNKRNELYVLGFQPYYDYEGPLRVTGLLKVFFSKTTSYLNWNLKGADANCLYSRDYPNGKVSNDCGIHIHNGTSCSEDAGPHFYKTKEDPWKTLHYKVRYGSTRASAKKIKAGLSFYDALGHAVIVHDINGKRIACGILVTKDEVYGQAPYVVKSFVPYFNYNGPLKVEGQLTIRTLDTTQYLDWKLSGADRNCFRTPYPNGAISNDCGIHIHVGTSCSEDAGPHYFDKPGVIDTIDDPWTRVHYQVWNGKAYSKGAAVHTGLTEALILGHAVVVHDITGARIACGIIEQVRQIWKPKRHN